MKREEEKKKNERTEIHVASLVERESFFLSIAANIGVISPKCVCCVQKIPKEKKQEKGGMEILH